MSIQKITFKGLLDHLSTKESPKWHVHLQASQFELNGFKDSTSNGLLTLNIGPMATRNMELHDDCFTFNNRKHGIEQFMSIPYTAIMFVQDPDSPNSMMPWPYFLDHGDEFYEAEEPEVTNVVEFKVPERDYLDIPANREHSDGAKVLHMIDFRKGAVDPTITQLQEMGLVNEDGTIDVMALAAKAQRKSSDVTTPVDYEASAAKAEATLKASGILDANGEINLAKVAELTFDAMYGGKAKAAELAINIMPGSKAKEEPTPTLEERVGHRRWVVIEGGNKGNQPASMPFFDEIYHAKRERREREALLAKINLSGESGVVAKEIRSDGSDGKSVHFPDLDVAKCYFPTKRIERPSWMTVINGGKDVAA